MLLTIHNTLGTRATARGARALRDESRLLILLCEVAHEVGGLVEEQEVQVVKYIEVMDEGKVMTDRTFTTRASHINNHSPITYYEPSTR